MVLLTLHKISSTVTKAIGPSLFRTGLFLRKTFVRPTPNHINNYWIDMLFLIPYSQKLLSLAIYEESKLRTVEYWQMMSKHLDDRKANNGDKVHEDEDIQRLSETPQDAANVVSHTEQLSNIRLGVLNEILRPSILPTEQWGSDIEGSWRYNIRLVAWLRKEFLLSKYGPHIQKAMILYPSLRMSPQLESSQRRRFLMDLMHRGIINVGGANASTSIEKNDLRTNFYHRLPTKDVVVKALEMKHWAIDKNSSKIWQSVQPIVEKLGGTFRDVREDIRDIHLLSDDSERSQSSQQADFPMQNRKSSMKLKHATISPETNLKDTSLEVVLDIVTNGYISNCGPLNALCQEANFYQLWTKEYIHHLGDYLLQRSQSVTASTIILDVGAGDGLLVQCLSDYMKQENFRTGTSKKRKTGPTSSTEDGAKTVPTLVATDDMSWNIFTKARVERLSVTQALEKYATRTNDNQVIVLCSWMPMGEDWTAYFRASGVQEYILIGESDDGSCGHNWWTWGNPAFAHEHGMSGAIPPYQQEGFKRWDMDVLTPYQFSSFDCAVSKSSTTVSFRNSHEA